MRLRLRRRSRDRERPRDLDLDLSRLECFRDLDLSDLSRSFERDRLCDDLWGDDRESLRRPRRRLSCGDSFLDDLPDRRSTNAGEDDRRDPAATAGPVRLLCASYDVVGVPVLNEGGEGGVGGDSDLRS